MSGYELGWKFVIQRWKDSARAMYWVLVRFWPASLLGVGGLVAELTNSVSPPGAGTGLFLGWFFLAMLVGHHKSMELTKGSEIGPGGGS